VVVPITSRDRGIPRTCPLSNRAPDSTGRSWAGTEDLASISQLRLRTRLGRVREPALAELRDILRTLLDL